MNIFKSLPAFVAVALGFLGSVLAIFNALQPLILAKVPTEVYPIVLMIVGFIIFLLHYETVIEDAAGVLAGTVKFSTLIADLQAAVGALQTPQPSPAPVAIAAVVQPAPAPAAPAPEVPAEVKS